MKNKVTMTKESMNLSKAMQIIQFEQQRKKYQKSLRDL